MRAEARALPILSVVHGLCEHYGKHYCFPSQRKLLELLSSRVGLEISIATLNRWLRVIQEAGFIRRKRRIRRDKVLGTVFQSTLYFISISGYMLLARLGLKVWDKVRDLVKGVRPDKRDPRQDEIPPGMVEAQRKFANWVEGLLKVPS